MWKIALASVVFYGLLQLGITDNDICDGVFKIESLVKCENPEKYSYDFDIQKRKINRTHDGFNISADLMEDFSSVLTLRLETFVKCDGGYKASDVVGPSSACTLLEEYCQEMFVQVLKMAGINPPTCPIPRGPFVVQDLVLDYNTLPQQHKCGESKVQAYLMRGATDVACITVYYTFSEREDDD